MVCKIVWFGPFAFVIATNVYKLSKFKTELKFQPSTEGAFNTCNRAAPHWDIFWHAAHSWVWFGATQMHSMEQPRNNVSPQIQLFRVKLSRSLIERPPVLFTAWRHRGFFRDFEAKARCRTPLCRRRAPPDFKVQTSSENELSQDLMVDETRVILLLRLHWLWQMSRMQ